MPADGSGAIGPVSARYAAQIRELLYAQAMQRMAADQEAARARADSDRLAQAEAAAKAEEARQPLRARVEGLEPSPYAAPIKLPDAPAEAKPSPAGTPHLVDIQA